jgi:AcrR family transcriptional regulator
MSYAVTVMPRARSLTPDRIAAAALDVVDRSGLAALSMRSVGAELGMGAMSLYRYVEDRRRLEELVVDRVLGAVDLTLPDDAPWTERLSIAIGRIRAAVMAHPAVVPLIMTHRHTNVSLMRCGESLLRTLADAGFVGAGRVVAFRALLGYLVGALTAEHLGPLAGAGTQVLAQLPTDNFPCLVETAGDAREVNADDGFQGGLAVLLAGLQAARPLASQPPAAG